MWRLRILPCRHLGWLQWCLRLCLRSLTMAWVTVASYAQFDSQRRHILRWDPDFCIRCNSPPDSMLACHIPQRCPDCGDCHAHFLWARLARGVILQMSAPHESAVPATRLSQPPYVRSFHVVDAYFSIDWMIGPPPTNLHPGFDRSPQTC